MLLSGNCSPPLLPTSPVMDIEQLIHQVQARPPIYDFRHPDYTNKEVRDRYWEEIADSIGFPVDECKRKWRNLRDAFMRELRRESKTVVVSANGETHETSCQTTGPGPSKRKKYLHYDQMQFLAPILGSRRVHGKCMPSIKHEFNYIGEEVEDWFDLVETSLGAQSDDQEIELKPSQQVGEDMLVTGADPRGDCRFLLSLLPMISRLSDRDNSRLRIEMMQLLHNALYPPEEPQVAVTQTHTQTHDHFKNEPSWSPDSQSSPRQHS